MLTSNIKACTCYDLPGFSPDPTCPEHHPPKSTAKDKKKAPMNEARKSDRKLDKLRTDM